MIEKRIIKLIVGKSGSGSDSYKLSIPTSFVKSLNLGIGTREVEISLDENLIKIEKHYSKEEKKTNNEFYKKLIDKLDNLVNLKIISDYHFLKDTRLQIEFKNPFGVLIVSSNNYKNLALKLDIEISKFLKN